MFILIINYCEMILKSAQTIERTTLNNFCLRNYRCYSCIIEKNVRDKFRRAFCNSKIMDCWEFIVRLIDI